MDAAVAIQNQKALAAQETQSRQEQEVAEQNRQAARVSILDPDFMLIFPLAIILDVLSYILMGLDAGIIAAVVNFILGWIVMLWMIWRGKRVSESREMYQRAVANARQGRAGLAHRRTMTQRTATRALGQRASRRIFRRSFIMYIGNSIPIVNFIPFWIIGMIMMLREQ